MAKFDGKQFRGMTGKLVQRKTKHGLVIQMAPQNIKQTKGTKKAQKVFGQGSTLACSVREGLLAVIRHQYDGDMITRFSKPFMDILKQCVDNETGQYTFQENSFERLAGIEFNLKSLLINSLLVKPVMSLDGMTMTVSLPEIQVAQELKFPGQTNTCTLTVALSVIALHASKKISPQFQSVEISSEQVSLPQQDFQFDVPEGGCLCVVGTGLVYASLKDNVQTLYNTKDFNPANVCGAVVSPGVFVEPPPRTSGNTTQGPRWRTVDKLKLPAKELPLAGE